MTWRGFAALDTQRCWTVTTTPHVDHVDQVFYHYSFQQLAELSMEQWIDKPVAVHVQLEETQAAAVWDKDKLEALLGCLYVQHPLFVTEQLLKNYPLWGYGPACELPSATKLGWAEMLDAAHLAPVVIRRAADGLGLFALEEIESGALIGEYTGMIQTESGSRETGHDPYGLMYPSSHPQGTHISARHYGNAIRCVNHSSTRTNATFTKVMHHGMVRVACVAAQQIHAGDQILVDYGSAYWRAAGVQPLEL